MASNTRDEIVRAALSLAEEHQRLQGVTISLESVAQRAGITKPGLMYHFPTKEALMLGVVEHVAARWQGLIAAEAGAEAEDLSPFARHRAYVAATLTHPPTRADYWACTDAHYQPLLAKVWRQVLGPWLDTTGVPTGAVTLLNCARFVADGAWSAQATDVFPADDLTTVRDRAMDLIDEAERIG